MDATANFETIYRSHISLVRKIIASFKIYNGLADDLAQQAFLQAFEKLSTLRDLKLLKPWIASITRNICLESFRCKKFVELDSDEFKVGLWFDPESGEAEIELEQNLALLNRLLNEYRKEPRGVIARLFYLEGKTSREIAAQLNVPQNTVLSHLLHFRREMKAGLILLQKKAANQRSYQ